MKKVFVIMLGVFFLAGCGAAARDSGFYQHNTMYRNFDHLKFSAYGYTKVEPKELEKTKKQDWWGVTIWGSK
jgi:hypothetical protein